MGVVHKLKPEITKFILDNKQADPHLSCRSLAALLLEKLHVEVSKSSINAIFKGNNLSMPVGRRQKPKKKKFNMPALPVIESTKAIAPVEDFQKPVLKEKSRIQEKVKGEIAEEKNIQKEGYGEKLLEKENARLQQERLAQEEAQRKEEERLIREEAQRKSETEKLAREKIEAELKEKEAQRKIEEDRVRQEQLRLQKIQEEETAKQKEADRLKLEEETRLKEEQERLAREAELKAERERWARLSEEQENKRKEALKASQVASEGARVEPGSGSSSPRECTGIVLLQAIDYLIRGSVQLSEAIQRRLGYPKEEVEDLTQALIFQDIVGNAPGVLNSITRNEVSADKLSDYLAQLQELKTMKLDLSRLLANIFIESRGIKMHFIDGSVVYLDAQMHTVWPSPYMPHDFSATITSIKDGINRYFLKSGNLVLFMAPGYDVPTKEFFTLLHNFKEKHETADNLILYGNKLDVLENITLNPEESRNFLFALWPRQFTDYRKVIRIGEFSLARIDCMNKDFYLAEIEIELVQPASLQPFLLKGCAIKLSLEEKIRLVVLSTDETRSLVSLANDYLCRWPNLDEGLHDFNRKIELFSCIGEAQQTFAYIDLPIAKSEPADLSSVFSGYSEALDAYLRWYFMPSGYEKMGLGVTRERFYNQKAQLIQDKDKMCYFFTVAHDYTYAKDLEYICRRLNERDIRADNGQRVCFESGFK